MQCSSHQALAWHFVEVTFTAASCRCIACATPQVKLQDAAGKLSREALERRDKRLHPILEKGWTWQVLPWQCEMQWPRLPDLTQRALNSSQNVASLMSELEVVVTIAELDAGRPENSDLSECVNAVARNNPPCKVATSYGKAGLKNQIRM